MKIRFIYFLILLLITPLFSGCELLGLIELDAGAATVGLDATAATAADASILGFTEESSFSLSPNVAKMDYFKIIIRSDLTTSGFDLLKSKLSPAEFKIIEGTITDEASFNSLLSKVRIAKPGSLSPRLYINTAYNQGVEIGELTSERTIRLLRNGRSYEVPGKVYTVKGNSVYLKDISNFRVLAHVNASQIILVLDEIPINGLIKVRVGTNIGYITATALIAGSKKKYIGTSNHNYSYNYRSSTCSKCKGNGSLFCFTCSGKGSLLCPICLGARQHICEICSGSGKETCVKCEGLGNYFCEDCSGTGKKNGQFCSTCNGRGKLFCSTCNGKGNNTCRTCLGKETILCNKCDGHGSIPCDKCDGRGRFPCQQCAGAGITWIAIKV